MDGLFAEEFDSTLKDDLIDRLSLLCDDIKFPHDDMISTYTSTECTQQVLNVTSAVVNKGKVDFIWLNHHIC